MDKNGRFYLWVGDLPKIFGPDGKFVAKLGRLGSGPGELRGQAVPIPLPGDSTLVLQPKERRATVFGPDHQFVRQIGLPGPATVAVIVRWPDSVLVAAAIADRSRYGWPLHMISLAGSTAKVHLSGGAVEQGESVYFDWLALGASDTSPWLTVLRPYVLTQFDDQLRPIQVLQRNPSWWVERRENSTGNHHTPPSHQITGLSVDSDGLWWVFIRGPAETWREGWADVPVGAVEIPSEKIAYEKLFNTIIEVIDPTARRVIARSTTEWHIIKALPGRRAVAYAPDEAGLPKVLILDLSLHR